MPLSEATRLAFSTATPARDAARGAEPDALRRRALDGGTTRHSGYALSQKERKRIEECFGWLETIALMQKVRHRGVCKVHWVFTLEAYSLVRMRNLAAAVRVA
jgi:hypothetical protein